MLSVTYFALAMVSAVVPWVNAEVVMLSAVPLAGSNAQLAGLVGLVTLGQMTGKSIMYWASRMAAGRRVPRLQAAIDRWRDRFRDRPASAFGVMFLSSVVGFPPFYVVSMVAGALNVAFASFFAIGCIGRLIHFTLVAFAPELVRRSL
jgi:membrane protein YqaA with SNARE-associated domain